MHRIKYKNLCDYQNDLTLKDKSGKLMNVYVSTSDGYDYMLKPFAFLFNKYWGTNQPVNILGYRKPPIELPSNFNFISLGDKQISVNHWSTDLRNFFKSVEDENFIYTVEDSFLTYPVDEDVLSNLLRVNESYSKLLGRISLNSDSITKKRNTIEEISDSNYDIQEYYQGAEYRWSVLWSIWNKEYLLKYLKPNLSPWQAEVNSIKESKNDGYRIMCANERYPIHHCLAKRKNSNTSGDTIDEKILSVELDFRYNNFTDLSLDDEVIEQMIEENIITKDRRVKV